MNYWLIWSHRRRRYQVLRVTQNEEEGVTDDEYGSGRGLVVAVTPPCSW